MSYLDPTRLHFAGRFQANVSTVNNDPAHFNIETFKDEYQEWGSGATNGWWNPQGSGDWRLLGCKVTGAWVDGNAVPAGNPLLACIVADSDSEVPGKLVDLDPDQQMVSQIWGLTVRIADKDGRTLMSGKFEPCAFFDLWSRATRRSSGDAPMGAHWHSVLTDVFWAENLGSYDALLALKSKSVAGKLSIKFNVDGFGMGYADADFTTGRIVGTIGPYLAGEPHHMLRARQLQTSLNGITPSLVLNKCYLGIDADRRQALIDLGNALPTETPGGPLSDLGMLRFGFADAASGNLTEIGEIGDQYPGDRWYECTAGIVQIDLAADPRSFDEVALAIYNLAKSAKALENPGHAYLQSDQIVARLSPGETVELPIFAVRNGAPLANAVIQIRAGLSSISTDPTGVLSFPQEVTTDANGMAALKVTAADPGTPRWAGGAESGPDGQVYGLTPVFADADLAAGQSGPWNFLSFQVYSAWQPKSDPPSWNDIQPIMQQYANLYPVMNRFLDLSDQESVKGNLYLLKLAFELPMNNPNHMPVTRDLSPAKRAAILTVLEALGSEPTAGEAVPRPPTKARDRTAKTASAAASLAAAAAIGPALGGKTSALIRAGILPNNEGDTQ